ncbi:MAG: hypothetical protein J0I12_06205 [Candidatus Eremiobacteraeota bacterium]|nr:hypothetical protein [Candidatus Eremiobacteraeota bacterium]
MAFLLTYLSYEVLEYYERLESETHGFSVWPGLLFGLCFMVTLAALLTTLIVTLFWRREAPEQGTGLSPE